MALPAAYTETTFKEYLHALLNQGGFAGDLGWSIAAGSYDEVVNDALLHYGADDITAISGSSNIHKMRVAGRVALWEAVVSATAHYRSASADGISSDLGRVHANAVAQLERAKNDAANAGLIGATMAVGITTVRTANDPYRYPTDAEISEWGA